MNKSNYNLALAILQDIKGSVSDKAASTAAIAEADIKKDGFDRNDAYRVAANSVLDQSGDKVAKVQFDFESHPDFIKDLCEWADMDIVPVIKSGRLDVIQDMLTEFLRDGGIKSFGEGGQFESDLDTIPVKIGDKTYNLLYLYTEDEKETGLKNVEDMESSEGALFDYSDNPQSTISFWMKDTTIALRILFINKDGVVVSAHNGEPLSEELITEESEPIYWVIELNQSEQIPQGTYTNLALREEPEAEPEDDTEDETSEDEHPELKVNSLYVYGSDGEIQAEIQAGARIFSRSNTKTLIKLCKRAYLSKLDKDYKKIGRKVFEYIRQQDSREPEYVS